MGSSTLTDVPALAVLISGQGSNLQAIQRAIEAGSLPARISLVLSNRADAPGYHWAQQQGLNSQVISHRDFAHREEFDEALAAAIDHSGAQWIVLAGFLRQLTTPFVERYLGRMVNIHPSLLPAFPGLHTHQRALEAGVRWHGATVHFVTPDLDAGPIIAQAILPVQAGESAQALAKRVQALEHQLYPAVLVALLQAQCRLENGQTHWAVGYHSPTLSLVNPELL